MPIVVQIADNDSAGVLITESDGSTVVGGGGPPDTYEIVFSRGRYLAGIHEAGSLEAAGTLAGRLAADLAGAYLTTSGKVVKKMGKGE